MCGFVLNFEFLSPLEFWKNSRMSQNFIRLFLSLFPFSLQVKKNKLLRFLRASPRTTTRIGRTSSTTGAQSALRTTISSSSSSSSSSFLLLLFPLRSASWGASSRFLGKICGVTSTSSSPSSRKAPRRLPSLPGALYRRALLLSAPSLLPLLRPVVHQVLLGTTTTTTTEEEGKYSIQTNATKEECMVTTPIYYVNDKPHIGHVYTSTVADIYARYKRLQNMDVFFLTGTDEHGLKVEQSAEKRQIPAQALADENSLVFQEVMKSNEISFDDFIRTTDETHDTGASVRGEVVKVGRRVFREIRRMV